MIFKTKNLNSISIILLAIFVGVSCYDPELTIINRCNETIWLGAVGESKAEPNWNWSILKWNLASGERTKFRIPKDLSVRIWGRTGCSEPKYFLNFTVFSCETGDCGPKVECESSVKLQNPVTVGYINITEWSDEYRVSLINGFNLPISIVPKKISTTKLGGFPIVQNWCENIICNNHQLNTCPEALKQFNSNGSLIGCLSVCDKYQSDEACCRGEFKDPEKCLNYEKASKKIGTKLLSSTKINGTKNNQVKKISTKQLKYIEYGEAVFKKFCPLGHSHIYQDFSLQYMHISMPSYIFNCKKTGYNFYFC